MASRIACACFFVIAMFFGSLSNLCLRIPFFVRYSNSPRRPNQYSEDVPGDHNQDLRSILFGLTYCACAPALFGIFPYARDGTLARTYQARTYEAIHRLVPANRRIAAASLPLIDQLVHLHDQDRTLHLLFLHWRFSLCALFFPAVRKLPPLPTHARTVVTSRRAIALQVPFSGHYRDGVVTAWY